MAHTIHQQTRRVTVLLLFVFAPWILSTGQSDADVTTVIIPTDLTSGVSLGTVTTQQGNRVVITGGTQVGPNLFHSFDRFSVGTDSIAQFSNTGAILQPSTPPATITDIFARVRGGQPSEIDGAIQTRGFGSANLWFMNPNGIIFGPNATLDIGGSATFTTAETLTLADGGLFNAKPGDSGIPSIDNLTVASVTEFGFVGADPAKQPSPITVTGSTLSVTSGHDLALIGGDITISGGHLHAPEGTIRVTSVGRIPGETSVVTIDPDTSNHTVDAPTLIQPITFQQAPFGKDAVIDSGSTGQIQLNGVIYNGTNATGFSAPQAPRIVIANGSILVSNLPPTKLIVSSERQSPGDIPGGVKSHTEPSSKQPARLPAENRLIMASDRCTGSTSGEFSSFIQRGRDISPLQPGGFLASPPRFDNAIPQVSTRAIHPTLRATETFVFAPGTIAFLPHDGGC